MSQIAYYDATGRYVWTGNPTVIIPGAPKPPPNAWESGTTRYDGPVDAATQYHDASTDRPAAMGARPSMAHRFDFAAKAWRDPRTLAQLRDAKWAEVKAARDAQESSSFPYMGKRIDSNLLSVTRINTAVRGAEDALANQRQFAIVWTCADNTLLALDAADMIGMPLALAAYAGRLHEAAAALRVQIYEAGLEALSAITWNPDV